MDLQAEVEASVAVVSSCYGTRGHRKQSGLQTARLVSLFERGGGCASEVPGLLQTITGGKWHPDDLNELAAAVRGMMSAGAKRSTDEGGRHSSRSSFTSIGF